MMNKIIKYLLNDKISSKIPHLSNEEKIEFKQVDEFIDRSEILVVIHIYYVDFIDEIISYLKNIKYKFDIYISVSSDCDLDFLGRRFSILSKNVKIVKHFNRGRDVGPFIMLLNSNFLDGYKYVCKIHAKGSKYSNLGSEWRNEILSELLGSPMRVQSILSAMKSDDKIGLVGPSGQHLSSSRYWGDNKRSVTDFCKKMNIPKNEIVLDFFAGTMFWFKPIAISKIKRLNLSLNNMEIEKGQRDGTVAHALERLFNLTVISSGFYCTESADPYKKIVRGDDANNRVIVLS